MIISRVGSHCLAAALLSGCAAQGISSAAGPSEAASSFNSYPGSASKSRGDLLYVANAGSDGCCAYVLVSSYPQGKHVATLSGFSRLSGECSDAKGDVFMVSPGEESSDPTTVYEYAHGGSIPIATLSEPGEGFGCAVDPTTGNLAVANVRDENNPYKSGWGDVAIFPEAEGNPTMSYSANLEDFWYCGYDNRGNLYLSTGISGGYALASIDAGRSSSIEEIELKTPLYGATYFAPSVQWDGKEMTVSSTIKQMDNSQDTGPVNVYRLSISGLKAMVVGKTVVRAPQNRQRYQSWIQGKNLIGITYYHGRPEASFWPFPQGGNPTRQKPLHFSSGSGLFEGVTVSRAPTV